MYIGRRTGSRLEERRDRVKSTRGKEETKEKGGSARGSGAVSSETERGRKQRGKERKGKRRERLVRERISYVYRQFGSMTSRRRFERTNERSKRS